MKRSLDLVLTVSFLAVCAHAEPQQLDPVESLPKEIGGLEFSVVTQAVYSTRDQDALLQLRITNRGKAPILFPTFDSISVILTDPDRKPLRLGGNRDATSVTPNLLLHPGKSFHWPISSRLHLSRPTGSSLKLDFRDLSGSASESTVRPGSYSLRIDLVPTPYDFTGKGKLPARLWSATGSTEPVSITLSGD